MKKIVESSFEQLKNLNKKWSDSLKNYLHGNYKRKNSHRQSLKNKDIEFVNVNIEFASKATEEKVQKVIDKLLNLANNQYIYDNWRHQLTAAASIDLNGNKEKEGFAKQFPLPKETAAWASGDNVLAQKRVEYEREYKRKYRELAKAIFLLEEAGEKLAEKVKEKNKQKKKQKKKIEELQQKLNRTEDDEKRSELAVKLASLQANYQYEFHPDSKYSRDVETGYFAEVAEFAKERLIKGTGGLQDIIFGFTPITWKEIREKYRDLKVLEWQKKTRAQSDVDLAQTTWIWKEAHKMPNEPEYPQDLTKEEIKLNKYLAEIEEEIEEERGHNPRKKHSPLPENFRLALPRM